jgi:hypothetical protein
MTTIPVTQSQLSIKESARTTRPEIELLLCCARTQIDPMTVERIKVLLQQDIDWTYFIQTSARHGVMPFLYWSLNATCPELVPKPILSELRNFFHTNAQHNLLLTQELLRLLNLFQEHAIPAIPFKGPVLAVSAYGNLALRQFCDLDILVHERNGLRSKEMLVSQGYRFDDDGKTLSVERQWGIVQLDVQWRITRKEFGFNLDSEGLWKRRKSISVGGTTVFTLSTEDLLLLLCVHGSKHLWERLAWICDIAELVRVHQDIDWEKVIERASRAGTKRMLFLGLFLSWDLLEANLPEKILQRIQADPVVKSLAAQLSERMFAQVDETVQVDEPTFYRGERNVFFIRMHERPQDRIRFFLLTQGIHWLIPNKQDQAFLPLPTHLYFLYYLIRPIRLIGKYGLSPLKHLLGG